MFSKKTLGTFLITLGVVVTPLFLSSCQNQPLSPTSLKELQKMNHEYGFHLREMSPSEEMKSTLLHAGLLITETTQEPKSGLIVTLEEKNERPAQFLLLESEKTLTESELKKIANEYKKIDEFKEVELDQTLEFTGERTPEINLKKPPEVSHRKQEDSEGSSIRIGIFDTGADKNHSVFNHTNLEWGWNSFNQNKWPEDDLGHGTHIAGIITNQAPQATLLPYKIASQQGGRLSYFISALQKALDEDDLKIINMSFGISEPSPALEKMIQEAYERNIILVAAAGNAGSDKPFYPAAYPEVIAVGSVDRAGRTLKNSNYGDWVEITSLGHFVRSALPDQKYGYKSGTSQSTAFITAYLANLIKNEKMEDPHTDLLRSFFKKELPFEPEGKLKGRLIFQPF